MAVDPSGPQNAVGSDRPSARAATPRHLWLAGLIFLGVYAIGAYDYVQVQVRSESYFEAQDYGPEQIHYFVDYPVAPLA
ncbi:hypothetical protein [Jiangella asiatica]|uniref:Uncharacterized protein n=1 Tax=Jiangella asiatica TaxID=2530372 RepID=A0A4R5D4V4_9ACTN|nr:hypothetical protein [Jiangella asiatica]TDE08442.1 hypothetical protein E1269_17170 [Jiangella asiatica]